MTGTLLTTGDTRADEEKALGGELADAAVGVREVGVTTVDDDITFLKVRLKLGDKRINCGASLDEKDDFAGTLELSDELLDRVGALDICA